MGWLFRILSPELPHIRSPEFHSGIPAPHGGHVNLGVFAPVTVILIPSPDPSKYTDIYVNYTIDGAHDLTEGFVYRYGYLNANGGVTLVTYGEGDSVVQALADKVAPSLGAAPPEKPVWMGNSDSILRQATLNLYRQKIA